MGEGEARSLASLCEPYWALGPGAAAEADPGLLRPTEEDGLLADSSGGQIHSGGPVCVGL